LSACTRCYADRLLVLAGVALNEYLAHPYKMYAPIRCYRDPFRCLCKDLGGEQRIWYGCGLYVISHSRGGGGIVNADVKLRTRYSARMARVKDPTLYTAGLVCCDGGHCICRV
jgi:hypothetical protein